ncbi:MFS transporter [Shouchella patagoniensis]|uniref:MFS transporter n=1 Tax=Shouchella patagoniensis TaxID=228576 RepID=UPI000994B01B|nr:MFS transporter [Shouchella patagoniensis]
MSSWRNPLLLLTGIGVSNIGGWVYLIALNLIVLNETGSPLAVALLYSLSPIATICSNVWAGSFIDRVNTRKLMIWLDLFRACGIALIPFLPSLVFVYIIAFIINMGSAIFQPTAMVYMTRLIPKEDRQRFNALRSFIHSCGTLIGPSIAGILFWLGTPYTAIHLNAFALFISAFIIQLLPNVDVMKKEAIGQNLTWEIIKNDFKMVKRFSKTSSYVVKIYLLFCGMTVFMTAIDSLESPFAKKVLLLEDAHYGFLLSLFGIGIILGSVINSVFTKRLAVWFLIGIGTPFIAVGYLVFYSAQSFYSAVLGVFLIGFAITFANTGFLTFYQNHVPVQMMGRFGSMFGVVEAVLIVGLTGLLGVAAEFTSIRLVGFIGSGGFLLLGILAYFLVTRKKRQGYFMEKGLIDK